MDKIIDEFPMFVLSVPSIMVAYMCICHLASKKWKLLSDPLWGYVLILGGTVIYFGYTFGTADFPQPGKLVTDIGLFFLFHREYQINKRRKQKRKEKRERKLSGSL